MDLSAKNLKQLLEDATRFRQENIESDWKENLFWYNDTYGKQLSIPGFSSFDSVFDETMFKRAYSVNLAYSVTRTMRDALYTRTPAFSIRIDNKDKDSSELAKLLGQGNPKNSVLDYSALSYVVEKDTKIDMNAMKADRTNRRVILDAGIFAYGVTKQGYNIDKDDKTLQHLYDPKELEKIGLDSSALKGSDLIKAQSPYLKRIDPRLMLFPPDTTEFGEFEWIAQEVYMSKEDALKKYGVSLSEDHYVQLPGKVNTNTTKRMVLIYEFHYFGKKPKILWLSDNGKILKSVDYPIIDKEGNAKNVYNFIWFNDGYSSFFPVADLTLVRSQIIEANLQKRKRVDHVNRFSNQYWFAGQWDESEIKDVCTGVDGSYVHSNDPRSKVGQIVKPQLGVEFYENMKALESEMYQVLGLSDYAVGGDTQKRKATEARYVENSYSTRLLSRIAMIDDFVHDQVDLLIEFKKKYMFLAEKRFTEGKNGKSVYWMMSGEALDIADPDIIVTKGSTFELDKDFQIQKANEFTKLTQAYAQVTNMPAAAKYAYELIGVHNAENFILSEEPRPVVPPGGDGGARIREVTGREGQVDDIMGKGLTPNTGAQ